MNYAADRDALHGHQMNRLRALLAGALPGNRFYAGKFAGLNPAALQTFDDLARLPFTTKSELAADQAEHPPYGTALSYPTDRYCRLHQTSGTSTGRPLRWLDDNAGWEQVVHCWLMSFPIMGLTPADRGFFPFSFGPFLGFWSGYEAASRFGLLCLPGGGMTSTARLRFLVEHKATVVFATPTYALHLTELAAKEGIDLPGSSVRAVVVAGEPGGGIPATRQRIADGWGARVLDHYGMTEVGPVAFEPQSVPGSLLVLETEVIAEVLQPNEKTPTPDGEVGELVLTSLGRVGSPLIRYRTGDLARVDPDPPSTPDVPAGWRLLTGGVLGRADDMIHVRGNNLYPAAIEAIIRRFPAVAEFRVVIDQTGPLADLQIEVEPLPHSPADLAEQVAQAIGDELLFRAAVVAVPPGTLPRYELKARRVVRKT